MVGSGWTQSTPGAGAPAAILKYFEAIGTGGIKDAFIGNLVFLGGRWADLFATVRFPKVLGMFVLGLWTVRTGIALSPSAHRDTLVRWRLLGWGVGLPANLIAAWAIERCRTCRLLSEGCSAWRCRPLAFRCSRLVTHPRLYFS